MIEINLLPDELKERESLKFELPDAATLHKVALGLVVFIMIQFFLGGFALLQRFEIGIAKRRVLALKEEIKETLVHKSETASAHIRLKQISFATDRKFFWSKFLNEITHSMTKGVWLRELSVTEVEQAQPVSQKAKEGKALPAPPLKVKCVKLEGSAVGQGQETAHIGKFVKSLKENAQLAELFGKIELSNINQRRIKDVDVYDFEILCIFRKEMV